MLQLPAEPVPVRIKVSPGPGTAQLVQLMAGAVPAVLVDAQIAIQE